MAGGFIAEETIQRVFDLNIVEVLKEYVDLRQAGTNWKCKSPFTDEKTASFMVSPAKGIFKDFSSGKGGSLVNFVMEYEQVSYPEAIEKIARSHNIEVIRKRGTKDDEERFKLYDLLRDATAIYHNMLNKYPAVIDYLHGRGFTNDTITAFKIGYAPPGKEENIRDKLRRQNYTLEEMVRVGLVKESRKNPGNHYDFFWNRLMFPIMNRTGNTIGFGGRYLTPEGDADSKAAEAPKYVNTESTKLFNKSNVLYGVGTPMINKLIRDTGKVAIVEGYTDVMLLQQARIPALAKLSGRLTEKQLGTLEKYALREVDIIDDGDMASVRGVMDDTAILAKGEYWPNIIMLPEGQDPAEYFQAQEDPVHAFNTMERLTPPVFYVKAAKKIIRDNKSTEEAEKLLSSTSTKLFLVQDLMKEYLCWHGSDGIIMGHLLELEKELELPKEILVSLHFDEYKKKFKLNTDELPQRNVAKRVMLNYLAGLMITPNEYAKKLFEEIPVDHPAFTQEQQELYAFVKHVKDEGHQFRPEYSKDRHGNKVATLREKVDKTIIRKTSNPYQNPFERITVYKSDELLFPALEKSPTLLLIDAYEEGRLTHIPSAFVDTIGKYFPVDIEHSAGSVKNYLRHHKEKQLFNDLFSSYKLGDDDRVQGLIDELDVLRR